VVAVALKEEIKSMIVKSGLTMNEVVQRINEKYDRNDSLSNLSNKLTRGTLKYREAEEIADAIGYRIEWIKQNDRT
jgi:hypothetical protein